MEVVEEKSDVYTPLVSEKFYEELYSKADILYFCLDLNVKIVSCNVTAQERLGYEKKKLSGKNFLSFFSEESRRHAEEWIKTCLVRGYVKDVETCMVERSGRNFWVRMNGLTESDDNGNPAAIRFYIRDISEIIRFEKQRNLFLQIAKLLQGNELTINLAEDVLSEIQSMMDSDGIGLILQTKNGEHLSIGNWRNTEAYSGLDAENFQNWISEKWGQLLQACRPIEACNFTTGGSLWTGSLSDMVLEVQSEEEKNRLISMADFESLIVVPIGGDEKISGYFVIAHREGSVWDEEDVKFFEGIVPIFGNVEKMRKQASTVTVSSEKKHFPLIEIPVLGLLTINGGIICSTNQWVENFLELKKEEIVGKPLLDFIDAAYQDMVTELFKKGISKNRVPASSEVVVLTGNGSRKWIECGYTVLSMNGDSVELCYWIDREDRQRLKKQLLQAKKMESLGLMAGGIVHEFNNLLACILGYSSLLSEEIPKDNPYYEDIQQINLTSEKATELTSRLMAYAQGSSYFVSALDMNQLITEVAGIISRTFDKNISIRAELDQKLMPIKADVSQIQQAIFQVALNARDAMPNGGKLIFQTRGVLLDEKDARLRFGGKPGSYVQIIISDTGNGMSGEVKESIFKPYFTTKNRTAGKGLGLSMVQEIIENHGGFFSVFSEKSKGTVFKIHLPEAKQRALKSQAVSEEKPSLGKETILLVDDEKILRETARKMLTRYGYKVISTVSSTEAIAIYKKYTNRIDLVILDVTLPGMGIKKVLGWFKKLNSKVKIIVSFDLGEKELIEAEIQQSLAGCIQKPFQVRPLLEKVHSVLNG